MTVSVHVVVVLVPVLVLEGDQTVWIILQMMVKVPRAMHGQGRLHGCEWKQV